MNPTEVRRACRQYGIWFRRATWGQPEQGFATTDIPANYLSEGRFAWAVFYLTQTDQTFAVRFAEVQTALEGAPVRDQGRKVGPYEINYAKSTINGRPVALRTFDLADIPGSVIRLEEDFIARGPSDETATAFDPESYRDHREHVLRTIARRRGQRAFRRALLRAYDGRCAVTGTSFMGLLEAAHITPYRGAESNDVRNGLLLRADIHTLFDLRMLAIGADGKVLVSAAVTDPEYRALEGSDVAVPKDRNLRPSRKALETHRAGFAP